MQLQRLEDEDDAQALMPPHEEGGHVADLAPVTAAGEGTDEGGGEGEALVGEHTR
jgi:hypothetical protein